MERNMRLRAEYYAPGREVRLYGFIEPKRGADTADVAVTVEFRPVREGENYDSFLEIPLEAANELMDDLWRIGARPTNVRNQSELVESKERHIDDLRAIATKLLDKVIA